MRLRDQRFVPFLTLVVVTTTTVFGITHRVPQGFATIQAAVNAASPGDTIVVSSGIYRENIVIDKALNLMGLDGAVSTIIQDPAPTSSWGSPGAIVVSINGLGPGRFTGFTIKGNYDVNGAGILVASDGWVIERCIIQNHHFGVNSYAASTDILDNVFRENNPLAIGAGGYSRVFRNVVFGDNSGGTDHEYGLFARGHTVASNNVFANCIEAVNCGGSEDSVAIRNNVITAIGDVYDHPQIGIRISHNGDPAIIENNIIAFCSYSGIFVSSSSSSIPNGYLIAYNNVSMNGQNYSGIPDLTNQQGNISSNPLFCDNDNQFYLASDSPCIDAGLPSVKDLDGSRSDLGMFGGAYSDPIHYAPSSFDLTSPSDQFSIVIIDSPYVPAQLAQIDFEWTKSFDRDPNDSIQYRLILGRQLQSVCRDITCSTYLVTDVIDTLKTNSTSLSIELSAYSPGTYYYTVEAVDNSGLFIRANTVRSFNYQRVSIVPTEFFCSQNFPNPFNAATRIRFSLPQPSSVLIKLYDVLGREITTLENSFRSIGFHELSFEGGQLPSGPYYYLFTASDYVVVRRMLITK